MPNLIDLNNYSPKSHSHYSGTIAIGRGTINEYVNLGQTYKLIIYTYWGEFKTAYNRNNLSDCTNNDIFIAFNI